LVPAEDLGPDEDLYNGLELHQPWMRDFLDPVLGGGGDAEAFQQSPKPTVGDRSFSPKGLHLISILVQLLNLCVAQGSILLIVLIFVVDIMVLLPLLLSR
jgi:hypothetical protein